MNKNVLPLIILLAVFASCSSAYKGTQTPDDVYYSPGKTQEYAKADNAKDENRSQERYNRSSRNSGYEDYTSSSDDQYLRMKIQNRYQWNSLDNNDYWYSPNYAYNNYYGVNSFNPYLLNSWGLNYYYSPFASIQPTGWFNNYYPSYGYGYGYSPNYGGYYGHGNTYGYYGYTPTTVIVTSNNRARTSRPLLGGYTNNAYSNTNSRRDPGGRYAPVNTTTNRYNNTNNTTRYNNTNNSNTSTPTRTYTPPASSSSSGSSSGGGSVSRPVRH